MLDRYLAAREQAIRPYLSIGNTEFIIRQLIGSSSLSFLPSFAIAPEVKKRAALRPGRRPIPYAGLEAGAPS